MRYGIVGSRSRKDRLKVEDFIRLLELSDTVISGGCEGIDTWAVEAAKGKAMKTVEYLPNLEGCQKRWERTKAYYARNKLIAQDCDVLVAFVSHTRKGGTENTIEHAKKLKKKIIIIEPHAPLPILS